MMPTLAPHTFSSLPTPAPALCRHSVSVRQQRPLSLRLQHQCLLPAAASSTPLASTPAAYPAPAAAPASVATAAAPAATAAAFAVAPQRPQLDWLLQWYPVAFVRDLDPSKPHRFELMGLPLVIWWEPPTQAWRVFSDICPHRLVPLSEGRISAEGQLQCGYHGWRFSGSGKCESIPQQGNAQTPRACSTAYPVAVRQGLLFVKPSPLPLAFLGAPQASSSRSSSSSSSVHVADLVIDSSARQPVIAAPQSSRQEDVAAAVVRPGWGDSGVSGGSSGLDQDDLAGAAAELAESSRSSSHSSSSSSSSSRSGGGHHSSGGLPLRPPPPRSAPSLAELLDESSIPIVSELEEPGWVAQDVWRDLPYDWATLVENVLDASHVPFTHHKSMSNRNKIGAYDFKVAAPGVGPLGFRGRWETGPRGGQLGPQSSVFAAPTFVKHRIDSRHSSVDSLTVVYATPSAPGRCRVLNRNVARLKREGDGGVVARLLRLLPRWVGHVGGHTLLEDDQVFLHLGEPEVFRRRAAGATAARTYYMASQADTYVGAFQTWVDRHGGGGPFGRVDAAALGPRLSVDQLMDRYSQHTENCSQCQSALRGVRRARAAVVAGGAFTAASALLAAAVALLLASSPSSASLAAAAASGGASSGLAGHVGAALLALGGALVGVPGEPAEVMLRAMVWALAAGACASAAAVLSGMEQRFLKGTHPPPRNDPSAD